MLLMNPMGENKRSQRKKPPPEKSLYLAKQGEKIKVYEDDSPVIFRSWIG